MVDISLSRLRRGWSFEAGFSGKKDVNGKRFSFGGFTPFASLEPRWHFSGESASDLYHTGGYLGVRLNGAWDRATIFGPSYPKGYDRPLYTLGFSPRFGWVFGVNENSYIGLSAGLEFYRTKVAYSSGGHYWRTTTSDSAIPVSLEMTYGDSLLEQRIRWSRGCPDSSISPSVGHIQALGYCPTLFLFASYFIDLRWRVACLGCFFIFARLLRVG